MGSNPEQGTRVKLDKRRSTIPNELAVQGLLLENVNRLLSAADFRIDLCLIRRDPLAITIEESDAFRRNFSTRTKKPGRGGGGD